jgi:hypothetical protein
VFVAVLLLVVPLLLGETLNIPGGDDAGIVATLPVLSVEPGHPNLDRT